MTKLTSSRGPGGSPLGLTREAILKAADTFELDDLSMPRLAKALGVTHSALYYHFPNKQALIQALVESTLQEIELPDVTGLPWREHVMAAALALRNVLLARGTHMPHVAASASAAASPLGEGILEALEGAGFPEPDALQLTELTFAWSFYSAWQAVYAAQHELHDPSAMNKHLEQTGTLAGSRLQALVTRYTEHSTEEIFMLNLEALLDRFAPGPQPGDSRPTR